MATSVHKLRIQRELNRNVIHRLADSPYKRDMLECCALYDEWEIRPRTMAKLGRPRKAPAEKKPRAKRRKAA